MSSAMEVRPNPTADNSSATQQQRQRHTPVSSRKKPPASSVPVDTTSVSQRLQTELMSLMRLGWAGMCESVDCKASIYDCMCGDSGSLRRCHTYYINRVHRQYFAGESIES